MEQLVLPSETVVMLCLCSFVPGAAAVLITWGFDQGKAWHDMLVPILGIVSAIGAGALMIGIARRSLG